MKKGRIKTGRKLSADDWVKEDESMETVVKRKQVNLAISEGLHHKFNVACALNGVKMTEVITNFIEGYVRENEKL
jgi:hypothetical protein